MCMTQRDDLDLRAMGVERENEDSVARDIFRRVREWGHV